MPDDRTDVTPPSPIDELAAAVHGRLDELEAGRAENRRLIQQHGRRTTQILALVVGVLLLGGFANARLISENGERVDDIQQSRADVIYNNCDDINQRNRNTVAVFDQRIADAVHSGQISGARLQRARESREFTVGLINALAPVQDCVALVKRRLGPDHPVPARLKK